MTKFRTGLLISILLAGSYFLITVLLRDNEFFQKEIRDFLSSLFFVFAAFSWYRIYKVPQGDENAPEK
jgi:hypothetical protein